MSARGPTAGRLINLYRAVSYPELVDIVQTCGFHRAPPSNQGKWFAESPADAARWGRRFYQMGGPPFHLVEVEMPVDVADQMFRLPNLDGIGPARYADIDQLPGINQSLVGLREVPVTALGPP